MIAALITEIKSISLPNSKRSWKVSSANGDIIDCEGKQFVRVAPSSHTLTALVLEKLDGDGPSNDRSITASVGLATLTKLRNEATALLLRENQGQNVRPGASLFDIPVDEEQPRKKMKRRSGCKKATHGHASVEVSIMVSGESRTLQLLQPVSSDADNIFVEYDDAALGLLLQYIREQGFDDEQRSRCPRDPALPKGIRPRKDKFIVQWAKPDGSVHYKQCPDLEHAMAWKANPHVGDDEGEHGDETSGDAQECDLDTQGDQAVIAEVDHGEEQPEQSQAASC